MRLLVCVEEDPAECVYSQPKCTFIQNSNMEGSNALRGFWHVNALRTMPERQCLSRARHRQITHVKRETLITFHAVESAKNNNVLYDISDRQC